MKPISWYKSLCRHKYRRQYGYFLIEGRKAVGQILAFHRGSIEELLYVDGAGTPPDGIPARVISEANMKSICVSRTPQGAAALVKIPPDTYTSQIPASLLSAGRASARVLLLEDVQDPGNAGTLIRTAAAFGYSCVIMSGKCADPFSPKAAQSSAGALLSLDIRRSDEYIDMAAELKRRGYELFAADLGGEDTRSLKIAGPHVIALGSEGAGLSGSLLDMSDRKIRIPIDANAAESLNVAAAGAIMMFMGGAL